MNSFISNSNLAMKRFLLKLSIFILLCCAIYSSSIVYALFFEKHSEAHYIYAQKSKMEKLDSIPSPRVLLVGGSNIAFGFDCKVLGELLNKHVYNTGVHAAIGLRYMIDAINDHIVPEDIVIIMPEYTQFSTCYNGSGETLTSAIVYSGSSELSKLNMTQLLNFGLNIPSHIFQNIKARRLCSTSGAYTYTAMNFNEFGDEVRHVDFPAPGINNPPAQMTEIDTYAIKDLVCKINKLRSNGCKVMLLWPTTISSQYNLNKNFINQV